jgi:hypothetical protein
MPEFIEHYINQGVDHIYIINNNSGDNIDEVITHSIYSSRITLITDNRNMNILTSNSSAFGHKTLLDENLYELAKQETEWLILIDADEFMYGKNGHTIKTYLETVDKSVGCIYVIWNIVNPNKDVDNKLLTDFSYKNNNRRLNYDSIQQLSWRIKNANDFGKSIIRTSMLIDDCKFWLHKNIVSGETITNYGACTTHFDNGNNIDYSEANFKGVNITLNHYAIRNMEDYEKKRRQIDVVSEKNDFINGLFEIMDLDESFLMVDTDISACMSV